MLGAAGGILTTLGMFLLSVSAGSGGQGEGKYWAIWLTQGLTVGLGMSFKFVYSSQVVAGWFVQRRGLAIGITASGASIGESPSSPCGDVGTNMSCQPVSSIPFSSSLSRRKTDSQRQSGTLPSLSVAHRSLPFFVQFQTRPRRCESLRSGSSKKSGSTRRRFTNDPIPGSWLPCALSSSASTPSSSISRTGRSGGE